MPEVKPLPPVRLSAETDLNNRSPSQQAHEEHGQHDEEGILASEVCLTDVQPGIAPTSLLPPLAIVGPS